MKKYSFAGILVLLSVSLSACTDNTTPDGVVAMAFEAVKKHDLERFELSLGGEAAQQYGNADGMKEMERQLDGQNVSIGAVTYLEHHPTNCHGQCFGTVRIYEVKILAQPASSPGTAPAPWKRAISRCLEVHQWNGGTGNHTTSIQCQISHWTDPDSHQT